MAKDNFHLEIISPDGIQFTGDIESVTLPTILGEITILPNHASLSTKLVEGEIKIINGGKATHIAVSGGFFEITNNQGQVLSDFAIRAESIELAKAEERKREAEIKLSEKKDTFDTKIIERDLQRSILELKFGQNIKRRQKSQ